jgi:hypothetical protein
MDPMLITSLTRALGLLALFLIPTKPLLGATRISTADPNIAYSPYNWYQSATYAQSPNPGAYLKLGFTGASIGVELDVSPLQAVPMSHYPVVRYSIDNGPAVTVQLTPTTRTLRCAQGLRPGSHSLLLQYVAGYVFLDFWTPVNVLRVTGFSLDDGATTLAPTKQPLNVLFLGDSITNGDDDTATFAKGITNEVDTQDATIGYPSLVASAIGAEYGVVAYGGASWGGRAADGHTPGLMTFATMLDSIHSRLVDGKFSPVPSDIFINMGENAGPGKGDVQKLISVLRAASSPKTNLFLIIPFSGRSRDPLTAGFNAYREVARRDNYAFVLDLGDNPYLTDAGPTMLSVDGQHPLATLHGLLGAQLVNLRAQKLRIKGR